MTSINLQLAQPCGHWAVMASNKASFFNATSYVVVGNSRTKGFPVITYRNLRRMGKTVYPVDLGGGDTVEGDKAYASVAEVPGDVDAAIIEVPAEQTLAAAKSVVEAGIGHVWLHQRSDTPAVVSYLRDHQVDYHTNGCAVMYTNNRLSMHSIHRGLWKMLGKY